MSIEYLKISSCPICNNEHRYKLDVERSVFMKMMTMDDMNEPKHKVKFTRFFICPINNDEFQAKFILSDTSSDRIKKVRVAGVADHEQ